MKIAKCDKEDLEHAHSLRALEDLVAGHFFMDSLNDWRNWPNDDPDRRKMQKCFDYIKDTEDCVSDDEVDPRLVIYEYMKREFTENPSGLARVVLAAECALEHFYDPDSDTLEYRPDIDRALSYYEKHRDEVDKWYDENTESDEEKDSHHNIVGKRYLTDNGFSTEDDNIFTLDNMECAIIVNLAEGKIHVGRKSDGSSAYIAKPPERHFGDEMRIMVRISDIRKALKSLECKETLEKLPCKL